MNSVLRVRSIFTVISLLAAHLLSAQSSGYAEYAEQRGYYQSYVDVLEGEGQWIVAANQRFSSFFSTASVSGFDLEGELLWETPLPGIGEVTQVYRVMRLADGGIAALGMVQECCDCTVPLTALFLLDADGVLETVFHYSPPPAGNVAQLEWGFLMDVNYSEIMAVSHAGDSLWWTTVDDSPLFLKGTGELGWIFMENGADTINASGNMAPAFFYDTAPIDASHFNGLWALLYENDLVFYDAGFNVVENYEHGLTNPGQVIANEAGFFVHSPEAVFRLDADLNSSDSYDLEVVEAFETHAVSYHNGMFIRVGEKVSLNYGLGNSRSTYAGWQLVELTDQPPVYYPDIAVVDVEVLSSSFVNQSPLMYYQVQTQVTVQNTGDVPVESFFLNAFQSEALCNANFTSTEFTEFIAPNASVTVSFGPVNGYALFTDSTGIANICVFSTEPDNLMDRNRANDSFCEQLEFTVSVDDVRDDRKLTVFPNPAWDVLRIAGGAGMAEYQIYNMHGKLSAQGFADLSGDIDVSFLASGMYVLEVWQGSSRNTFKFAVE